MRNLIKQRQAQKIQVHCMLVCAYMSMSVCICGSVICSTNSNIEWLTLRILEVTETNTLVRNCVKEICFEK